MAGRPIPEEAEATARRQLEALGALIRAQRQQAELTLRDLAAKANVSNPYLSQIERGLHQPSVRVLKAIAGALNLSAESLLVQAGVLEGDDSAPRLPTVEEAVNADPRLSADQRQALLSVYRSFVDDVPPASGASSRSRRSA
ncbi:MAG: helix-turn-helix domain-containing protein [Acidimicrobiales bacterium]